MIKIQQMRNAVVGYGLIDSEYMKDNDYIDNLLIPNNDVSEIISEIDSNYSYYYNLREQDFDGVWNELRYGNVVIDNDAPEGLTVKEWTKYLNNLTK